MKYGFGGRLTQSFPSQVIVDVTDVCNLNCVHCPHEALQASEHYGPFFLDAALARKAVDEVGAHGAQYIRFCAEGEPLVHPGIYDMLDYAVENSGTFVTLTTNGTTMDERRIEKLLGSGLHMVDVSLDAFDAVTYRKIRRADFDAPLNNALALVRMASGTMTKIAVSFIEQPANRGERALFEAFWAERGATPVIRNMHTAAGALSGPSPISSRRPCVYPWERIVIGPSGNLKFCPQDWFNGAVVADYRETTIAETWSGEFYARLREAHLGNRCFGLCKACPDWKHTRWPGEGRSYADLVREIAA